MRLPSPHAGSGSPAVGPFMEGRGFSAGLNFRTSFARPGVQWRLIIRLVHAGIATPEQEIMKAGSKAIEGVRIGIAADGRRAIKG